MYGKLVDGHLIPAPRVLSEADRVIYNPTAEMYAAAGWIPVMETPYPERPEGVAPEDMPTYAARWEQRNGEIVRVWVEEQPEAPEAPVFTVEQRVIALETTSAETREALEMILSGVTE